jgi:hypothetical protein
VLLNYVPRNLCVNLHQEATLRSAYLWLQLSVNSDVGDRSDLCAIHTNRFDDPMTALDWLAVLPLGLDLAKLVDQPAIRAFLHE